MRRHPAAPRPRASRRRGAQATIAPPGRCSPGHAPSPCATPRSVVMRPTLLRNPAHASMSCFQGAFAVARRGGAAHWPPARRPSPPMVTRSARPPCRQIQPGVASREEVTRVLGSPSTIGTFDTERWFYVSQRNEVVSFYQADITRRMWCSIDFDGNGIVQRCPHARPGDGPERSSRILTRPARLGNELTAIQQFLGNIGRFNTSPERSADGGAGRRPTDPAPGLHARRRPRAGVQCPTWRRGWRGSAAPRCW